MFNKVILIGRLANDPEAKWTPSGIPVTKFVLAVDRRLSAESRQSGQEQQADFIDIVAWRQAAEFASNYLGKGRLVAIEGHLQIRQYVAQDGGKRRAAEVVVETLKSLERPRDTQNGDDTHHEHGGYNAGGRAPERRQSPAAGASSEQPTEAPARRNAPDSAVHFEHEGDAFSADAELDDPFADE